MRPADRQRPRVRGRFYFFSIGDHFEVLLQNRKSSFPRGTGDTRTKERTPLLPPPKNLNPTPTRIDHLGPSENDVAPTLISVTAGSPHAQTQHLSLFVSRWRVNASRGRASSLATSLKPRQQNHWTCRVDL